MAKTSTTVKDRWNAANYDQIPLRVPKGDKDKIKACADRAGKSVNAFITDAVTEAMQKSERAAQ